MRCPNCDGPVTGEDQHMRYKPGVEPNAEWFCSAPSREELRTLRARVAELEAHLEKADGYQERWEAIIEEWEAMQAVVAAARHAGCEQCKGFDATIEIMEALAALDALRKGGG